MKEFKTRGHLIALGVRAGTRAGALGGLVYGSVGVVARIAVGLHGAIWAVFAVLSFILLNKLLLLTIIRTVLGLITGLALNLSLALFAGLPRDRPLYHLAAVGVSEAVFLSAWLWVCLMYHPFVAGLTVDVLLFFLTGVVLAAWAGRQISGGYLNRRNSLPGTKAT